MSFAGCGMVAGSAFMSIWGGGKKTVSNLFIFSAINGISLVITGMRPSIPIITCGLSLSFFTLPLILGANNTIWQTSIHPNCQGRVLSLFYTVTGLGVAMGNLSASPLTDDLLEPMLYPNGILASSVGRLIETGQGRGIGFLMVMSGLILIISSVSLYNYFSFKQFNIGLLVEDREISDKNTIEAT
jgi:hypothetical protein